MWTAGKNGNGYGVSYVDGVAMVAHRRAYQMLVGVVPMGLEIDHLCRNKACVNPDHLEPVTHRENVMRANRHRRWTGSFNAGKTHCPAGHAYDLENTRWAPKRRYRRCRACDRIAHRKAA
jgi:hypothetical protein